MASLCIEKNPKQIFDNKEQDHSSSSDFSEQKPRIQKQEESQVVLPEEKKNGLNDSKTNATNEENSIDKLLNTDCAKGIAKTNKEFFENFEILEPIKAGSSGAVLKIRTKPTKTNGPSKIMVSKILLNKSKDKMKKKYYEVKIHKHLHHKNIPGLLGFYNFGEKYSGMIIEYNKYGDLSSFRKNIIKRLCFSETLICFCAGQILEGLLYLNQKHIIHMDIKPQNILVDEFLNIKITDYSVSISYSNTSNSIDLLMVGTCYYMGPEVLQRKRISVKDASKIDIYSFGVLLYHLAFNSYPYELSKVDTNNYEDILYNIKNKELVFPENTGHSKMFKNFVKNCLEKDIKKRYNIYDALNDPWIKGYDIILNEKEILYNINKLMLKMLANSIQPFNDYINKDNQKA